MTLQVGSRLGHCDVTALIGEGGGMDQVYQATDTKLNREVAMNRVMGGVEIGPVELRPLLLVWSYDASPSRQSQ